MRKALAVSPFLALLAALTLVTSPGVAQDLSTLTGTWIVDSWENADGEVNTEPQRGLFVFGQSRTRDNGGAYSMMYVLGDEPRAEFAADQDGPTDAEKVVAYDSFVANSGRYTVEGDQLTYEAYMAKNPNYMAGWEDNGVTVTWSVEDDILTLHWTSGRTEGFTATLRRPGTANDEGN